MAPKDLVTTQYILTFDADEGVRTAASKSLSNLDERIANAILGDSSLDSNVLGYIAVQVAENERFAQTILLNNSTPTWAFVDVAARGSQNTCELIANNQARLLQAPDIARSLTTNRHALRSTIDRVIDFLVRNGVILDDVHEFEEALLRLTGEERLKAVENIEIPEALLDPSLRKGSPNERQMIEEEEETDEEEVHQSIEMLLRSMTAGQKVAMATKGNKSVRSTLLRDSNRLVAIAAITSPLITEPEVVAAAQSRSVHQDVIGHISRDKKNNWVKNYQVKLALVQNPKTQLTESMRLLPHLQKKDVKNVARSRNVPAALRTQATKLARPSG
jgi:hypothetical protein